MKRSSMLSSWPQKLETFYRLTCCRADKFLDRTGSFSPLETSFEHERLRLNTKGGSAEIHRSALCECDCTKTQNHGSAPDAKVRYHGGVVGGRLDRFPCTRNKTNLPAASSRAHWAFAPKEVWSVTAVQSAPGRFRPRSPRRQLIRRGPCRGSTGMPGWACTGRETCTVRRARFRA